MLSAIVFVAESRLLREPAVAVSRSLGGLVPAAMEGVIQGVTIAGPLGLDLGFIADHAGCDCVEATREADWLQRALSLSKASNCLLLRAGYVPGTAFISELQDYLHKAQLRAGFLRAEPEHWPTRFFPALAPIAAAVAPLDIWRIQPEGGFHRMTRGLRGQTLRTRMHRVF